MNKPRLDITGIEDSVLTIFDRAKNAAQEFGWPQSYFEEFLVRAKEGDFQHLLDMCAEYFDIAEPAVAPPKRILIKGKDGSIFADQVSHVRIIAPSPGLPRTDYDIRIKPIDGCEFLYADGLGQGECEQIRSGLDLILEGKSETGNVGHD